MKQEIDVFLELSCFFDDPTDAGNLISGSFDFSKSSLNIWNFMVRVLLKPGLDNFEHYFASVSDEWNCAVYWTFLALPFFGIGMKTDLFLKRSVFFFLFCIHLYMYDMCLYVYVCVYIYIHTYIYVCMCIYI